MLRARNAPLVAVVALGIAGCGRSGAGGVTSFDLQRRDEKLAATLKKVQEVADAMVDGLATAEKTVRVQGETLADLQRRVGALESSAAAERVRSADAEDIAIEEPAFRIVESEGVAWDLAWRVRVRNLVDVPVTFKLEVQFKDRGGFEVARGHASNLRLRPFAVEEFTGTTAVEAAIGQQVVSVSAKSVTE